MKAIALAFVLIVAGCGDDVETGRDGGGGSGTDTGTSMPSDGGGGGGTVGQLCANDDNCTGAGEVCCLLEAPSSCQLATSCTMMMTGIPCDQSSDCPNGGNVCCRVGAEQFCTRPQSCEELGGDPLP